MVGNRNKSEMCCTLREKTYQYLMPEKGRLKPVKRGKRREPTDGLFTRFQAVEFRRPKKEGYRRHESHHTTQRGWCICAISPGKCETCPMMLTVMHHAFTYHSYAALSDQGSWVHKENLFIFFVRNSNEEWSRGLKPRNAQDSGLRD